MRASNKQLESDLSAARQEASAQADSNKSVEKKLQEATQEAASLKQELQAAQVLALPVAFNPPPCVNSCCFLRATVSAASDIHVRAMCGFSCSIVAKCHRFKKGLVCAGIAKSAPVAEIPINIQPAFSCSLNVSSGP